MIWASLPEQALCCSTLPRISCFRDASVLWRPTPMVLPSQPRMLGGCKLILYHNELSAKNATLTTSGTPSSPSEATLVICFNTPRTTRECIEFEAGLGDLHGITFLLTMPALQACGSVFIQTATVPRPHVQHQLYDHRRTL